MPRAENSTGEGAAPEAKQLQIKRLLDLAWWLVLAAAALYVYRTVSPSIDLSEPLGAAPDFTLVDAEGRSFTLSEHRGKVVVLNFWATWCPPCRAELPGFVDLQADLRGEDVLFVGVALDEEGLGAVAPFAAEHGINYPTLLADARTAARYGGIATVPTTFILDRAHRIRYRHEGLILKRALRKALVELTEEAAGPVPTTESNLFLRHDD